MGNEEVEKEDCEILWLTKGHKTPDEKGSAEALLPEEVTEWFTDLLHNGSKIWLAIIRILLKEIGCTHSKGGSILSHTALSIFSFYFTILCIFVLVLNKHKIPIKCIYNAAQCSVPA